MVRIRRVLTLAALCSWTATALAHLVATGARAESERIEWAERRNLFLLCSSLSTNALVFTTLYRRLQSLRGGTRRE